ncbi:MAG: hypothetical protein IT462_13130 [Planctomycetes bacterium]|nr:hypothetical protein [Planctomycetota bacterium]
MRFSFRNLLALIALASAFVVTSACSVMPFQGRGSGDVASKPTTSTETAGREDTREAAAKPENGATITETGARDMVAADTVRDAATGQTPGTEKMDDARLRDVELRWLKERAMIARQDGRLEDARDYLNRATALNPTNPDAEAKSMLDEINVLLAKDSSGVPKWDAIPRSAQEEFEIEAKRTYENAKKAEADSRWNDAINDWEKLKRLIKFAPYGAELKNDYDTKARAGLHKARVELQKDRKRLEDQALEYERRMADLAAQAEEERQREEVIELWRQAIYLVELRRFKSAEEIVDTIIRIDPQFRKAEELKRDIANKRITQLNRETFDKRIRGYYTALHQLRLAVDPKTQIVSYPTGLLAERIRNRKYEAPDAVRLDPRIQNIQNILASKTDTLNYDGNMTFQEVIQDIRRRANINLLVDRAVLQDKKEVKPKISLNNLPLGNALNIILADEALTTTFRDGVMFVIAAGGEADATQLVTRVHDVRDLTFNIMEFQGPRINLKSQGDAGSGGPALDLPPDDLERTLTADRIDELVRESILPGSWDEAPHSLQFFGGQLVATHTPGVQAELRDFLNDLRRIAGLMVHMEVRFISVEDDFLTDFGIDFRGNGGPAAVPNQATTTMEDITTGPEDNAGGMFDNGSGGIAPANPSSGIFFNNQNPNNPPVNFNQDIRGRFEHIYDNALGNMLTSNGGLSMQFAYFFNLTQINTVITAVQKQKKARVLTAPRLSSFNTQRANITIVNQIPYIQDFQLQTATTAAIANPVIDTILDGMVLDVRPTVSNDRRFITIEVQPTVADLLLPIPTFTTTLGPTSAVTIQIPEVKIQAVQTTVRVPDGGAVVIAGLKTVRDVWRESGVPILSDIPLLGVLFRHQGRSKEQMNLVIVLHARVVDLNDEEVHNGWAK